MTTQYAYEIEHYNEIPDFVFKDCIRILDVGCNNGYGAFYSRHHHHFVTNEYLGVDVRSFEYYYLHPIIVCDFLDFDTERQFDVIVFSHILEHFEIEQWERVLTKLTSLLSTDGYLVINVPFANDSLGEKGKYLEHKVLNIDEKLLSKYLEFQWFYRVGNRKRYIAFRDKGENILRAVLRFIGRIFIHHRYSFVKTYILKMAPARLVAVFQKRN